MIKLPTLDLMTGRTRVRPQPRRRVLPAMPWPYAAELTYSRPVLDVAQKTIRGVQKKLIPALPKLVAALRMHKTPRADDSAERLEALIAELRANYGISTADARAMAVQMLSDVSTTHAKGFVTVYDKTLTIDPTIGHEKWLPEAMELAVQRNVQLITSIPGQMLDQVANVVRDGCMNGERAEDIARALSERFGVAENRALLIARDQVGSWFSSMQQLRQTHAGIEMYVWSTARDERVRRSHQMREGRAFYWDAPPDGGPPGSEIMCRCVGAPIIESVDGYYDDVA